MHIAPSVANNSSQWRYFRVLPSIMAITMMPGTTANMLAMPPNPSRHGSVAAVRRLRNFLASLAPIAPQSTMTVARTIRQNVSSPNPPPLESTPAPKPITSTVMPTSSRRWAGNNGDSLRWCSSPQPPRRPAPCQPVPCRPAPRRPGCPAATNGWGMIGTGCTGGRALGGTSGGGVAIGLSTGAGVGGVRAAIFPAALPATIVRLFGANRDTLFRTSSDPNTASTISWTLWNRLAGSFSIARRIAEAKGSSMPVRSGLPDRCFMRISPTLDPM